MAQQYEIGKSYRIDGYDDCIYRGIVESSGRLLHKFAWGIYAKYMFIKNINNKDDENL